MDYIPSLAEDDPRLQYAIQMTKLSLSAFLHRFEHKLDNEQFFIKAGITEGEQTENVWVELFDYNLSKHRFRGKLANDPKNLEKIKLGEWVGFREEELNDLMITRGEYSEGGFLNSAVNGLEVVPIRDNRSFLQKIGFKK